MATVEVSYLDKKVMLKLPNNCSDDREFIKVIVNPVPELANKAINN